VTLSELAKYSMTKRRAVSLRQLSFLSVNTLPRKIYTCGRCLLVASVSAPLLFTKSVT